MAAFDHAHGVQAANVDSATKGAGVGKLASLAGAAVSLALVVGIAAWSYQLIKRDVSGVPVVRALEGPMRVQPENPGGDPADHQGLAVNTVAAKGTAAEPADRLVLAPKPVDLLDEDVPSPPVPSTEVQAQSPQVAPSEAPQKLQLGSPARAVMVRAENGSEDIAGSVEALVQELTNGVEPLSSAGENLATEEVLAVVQPLPDAEPEAAEEPGAAAETVPDVVLAGPGLTRSPRPQTRPERSGVPEAEPEEVAARIPLDVDPETLPAGTRMAQLGAYESADVARAEWDRLNGRFEDYLEGKSRVIQKATSGGRTFYRLRALGFDDISDARRFCAALQAENADCIPVTTR